MIDAGGDGADDVAAADFPGAAGIDDSAAALEDLRAEGAVGLAVVDGVVEEHLAGLGGAVVDDEVVFEGPAKYDVCRRNGAGDEVERAAAAVSVEGEGTGVAGFDEGAAGVAGEFFESCVPG